MGQIGFEVNSLLKPFKLSGRSEDPWLIANNMSCVGLSSGGRFVSLVETNGAMVGGGR